MRTSVSVTPSRIHFAAAAVTVPSTNNTRVRLSDTSHEQTLTKNFRLRAVRVSQSEAAFLRVGTKGQAPKDHRNRQDAVPQTCLEAIQERFQVRCNLSTRYVVNTEYSRHRHSGRTQWLRSANSPRLHEGSPPAMSILVTLYLLPCRNTKYMTTCHAELSMHYHRL